MKEGTEELIEQLCHNKRIWHIKTTPRQVSLDLLCFVLSLKRRRVQELCKEGIVVKASYRAYYATQSIKNYIQYLKKKGRWNGDEDAISKLCFEIDN